MHKEGVKGADTDMNGCDEGRRAVLTTDNIELILDLISRQMVSECEADASFKTDLAWWERVGTLVDLGQRVALMRDEPGATVGPLVAAEQAASGVQEEASPSVEVAVDMPDQRAYTTAEAAHMLGLATSSVHGAVRDGKLPAHRTDNGELRFTYDDIERYKQRPAASKGWDTRRSAAQVSSKSTRERKG